MALMDKISVAKSSFKEAHVGGATFDESQNLIMADVGFNQLFPERILCFREMIQSLTEMELLDHGLILNYDVERGSSIFLQNAVCMSVSPCRKEGDFSGIFVTFSMVIPHHQAVIVDRFSKKIVRYGETAGRLLGLMEDNGESVTRWKIDLDVLADRIATRSHQVSRMMIIRGNAPVYVGVLPIDFVDNANRFISLYISDLSDEIAREHHIAEQNNVTELIVRESNDIIVLSPEGMILGASGVLMRHWGWDIENLRGKQFISLVAPSDKARVSAYLRDNVDASDKIACIHRDGTIFNAVFALTPYESGSQYYTLIQVELDEEASVSLQTLSRYISIINSLPAMIAIGDEATITYANKYFLDFFRCGSVEEFRKLYRVIGATFTRRTGCLYPVNGAWLDAALAQARSGTDNQVMMYNEALREYRTFSLKLAPLGDDEDQYVLLFADITDLDNYHSILKDVKYMLESDVAKHSKERQNVEFLLKQQQELLVQQSKLAAMGEMIGIIAHQWKQPLNVIGLMAQNLAEDYEFEELSAENTAEYTGNIMKQVKYMAETIDDFSGFFRPSKTIVQFDLSKSVDSVTNLLRSFMMKSDVVIDKIMDVGGKQTEMVLGYPNELKQVLMNVMNNAKDAIVMNTKEGEMSSRQISVTIGEMGESGYIKVSDTGGGIPDHIMDTLFDPYVTTKGDKGTGIGLYMSKYIMDQMNGSISVENSPIGAVFTIKLPKA